MCFFNLQRCGCGCQIWSERQRRCDRASPATQECPVKQVLRGSYRVSCFECSKASSWGTNYNHLLGTYTVGGLAFAPSTYFCDEPGCCLDAGHTTHHEYLPSCLVKACSLSEGHQGFHFFSARNVESRDRIRQIDKTASEAANEALNRFTCLVLTAMVMSQSTGRHQLMPELVNTKSIRHVENKTTIPATLNIQESVAHYSKLDLGDQ